MSKDRGKAFDYTKNSWGGGDNTRDLNVSGLKKRLSLFLNLESAENRKLADSEVMQRISWDKGEQDDDTGTGSGNRGQRLPLKKMLRDGGDLHNYRIAKKKGKYELSFKGASDRQFLKVYQGKSEQECLEARQRLIDLLE